MRVRVNVRLRMRARVKINTSRINAPRVRFIRPSASLVVRECDAVPSPVGAEPHGHAIPAQRGHLGDGRSERVMIILVRIARMTYG